MAEVIHSTHNMMTKARNTQGDGEEGIEDDYDSIESLRDQHQDYVGTEESSNTLGTVRSRQPDPVSPPRCQIRAVVVLLVLLSLTLLAGLLRFAVQHKTISMGRDVEQLLQRLKNVTEQRDSLLCKQDCPGGWTKFGCKCYRLSGQWGSWNKSRELCVSLGADLVVVDSKEEMDFISRYDGEPWLGATDEASEGMWRWVDGTVLSADNPSWSGGKPDGGREKNSLRKVWGQLNTKWTDESCEDNSQGFCEYNLMT
ncbi:C-type lectin domain family 6 member A-like isoform X1 [Gadus morhua]|uniref:C-type lectin domain family 6 member A-like isoform X1 n=1 Tax=Gadus morhua TaxID=8049 RepID=UPI0011B41A38|nr:C-type lectin domain family 6 member A-like isoform X1 [Gadus morhua]